MTTDEMSLRESAMERYTGSHYETARQALAANDMLFTVRKAALMCANTYDYIDGYYALQRESTSKVMGVCTPRYQIVQNEDVASLMDSSGASSFNAVSMGGRQNTQMLVGKMRDIDLGGPDGVSMYINMMWGHDGKTSVQMFPSSVRPMCQNMSPALIRDAKDRSALYSFKHAGNVDLKMSELARALDVYNQETDSYVDTITALSNTAIGSFDRLLSYYESTYYNLFGAPENDDERTAFKNTRAMWLKTFQEEESRGCRPTVWLAYNSVTKNLQSMVNIKGRKPTVESKITNLINGKDAQRTQTAMRTAMALV